MKFFCKYSLVQHWVPFVTNCFIVLSHIKLCSSQEDLEVLPNFIPKDYDFNKLESTQPEGASKQVINFLAKGFL